MFGRKKKTIVREFDREKLQPVILASICTGEKTAGFKDRETGKFSGVCLIKDFRDLQNFLNEYGISEEEVKTIY